MKCVKIQQLISAYVDTEANTLEQLALLEHMKACPACTNELANQYTIKTMMKDYTAGAPDIDIASSVMSRISAPAPELTYPSFLEKHSKWMVATFIMVLTVAALYSAHINTADIAKSTPANPTQEYAAYIYEHISDAESYTTASAPRPMIQQVSLIK
jgi:hypothetical protein